MAINPPSVYVFSMPQAGTDRLLAANRHLLSPAERSRGETMANEAVRQRFTLARILLRHQLAQVVGGEPAALAIAIDARGKPCLAGHTGLEFNLAHSRNHIAIAIGQGVKVGVDVEYLRRRNNIVEIARRFFTAAEYQYLQRSDFSPEEFYTLWTLKEAYVKALGTGLGKSLDSFSFDLTAAISLKDNSPEARAASFLSCPLSPDDQLSVCTLVAEPAPLALYALDGALKSTPLTPLSSRTSAA